VSRISKSALDEIVVTDTIPLSKEAADGQPGSFVAPVAGI
jgi:phosphoribosylpyrophosphate synthetase